MVAATSSGCGADSELRVGSAARLRHQRIVMGRRHRRGACAAGAFAQRLRQIRGGGLLAAALLASIAVVDFLWLPRCGVEVMEPSKAFLGGTILTTLRGRSEGAAEASNGHRFGQPHSAVMRRRSMLQAARAPSPASTGAKKRRSLRSWSLLLGIAVTLLAFTAAPPPGQAAQPAAKQHLGQRLATGLRSSTGLPDWLILLVLSALPLVELRGGVPVGLWMGLRVPQVLFLCIVGNMMVIPPFLWALRLPPVRRLLSFVLRRAEKKSQAFNENDRWIGLAAFVGVPLPGTGAWTGAMVAYLMGMEVGETLTSILTGVCVAACIMLGLTLAGWYGCVAAASLCAVALGGRYFNLRRQAKLDSE